MPERREYIYARQSIDKKDSLSIDGQIELCRAECSGDPVVLSDKGFSGKNTARPAFSELMAAVENGRVSKIVCYRLDRVSRSITDFGLIWQTLAEHGVEFVSISEKFDTSTPVGRAMLYIIMVFAQLERETIAERVRDNYYQRVRRGAWPGGPAPYGFSVRKEKGAPARLVPDARLSAVAEIFRLYLAPGQSLGSVARRLNKDGVPAPRGAAWDSVSVARLLRQPAYVRADATIYAYYKSRGVVMANDVEAFTGRYGAILVGKRESSDRKYTDASDQLLALCQHEGVVDAERFLAAQRKLADNRQIRNTGKGKYTWLSGLLKCGECGYALRVIHDPACRFPILSCSGRSRLHICTASHSEKLHELEPFVASEMTSHIAMLLRDQENKKSAAPNQSELKATIALCDQKIQNLIEGLAEAGPNTMRYINVEIDRLENEKQAALSRMTKEQPEILRHLKNIAYVDVQSLPYAEKALLAQLMIDKILCTSTSTHIEWKV